MGVSSSAPRLTYEAWKAAYVERHISGVTYVNVHGDAGGPRTCTVSEATGYGMLAAALADDRATFDALHAYYVRSLNENSLASWRQELGPDGPFTPAGCEPCATDADLDVAYALFRAFEQWGDSAYRAAGVRVCAAMAEHCVHSQLCGFTLGDWATEASGKQDVMRSSDMMLSHVAAFVRYDTERAELWSHVLQTCIATLAQGLALHPSTALLSDFLRYSPASGRYDPVTDEVLEGVRDSTYSWNACRLPWRVAVYVLEHPHGEGAQVARYWVNTAAAFFRKQKPLVSGYFLDGRLSTLGGELREDSAFTAPALAAAVAASGPASAPKAWRPLSARLQHRYYGDTIALLVKLELQQLGAWPKSW